MNAIDLLLTRQSTPVLTEPAPSSTDIATILAAGMRVPDHAGLKPWYFHVISEKGLQRLSDLYVDATNKQLSDLIDTNKIDKQGVSEKITKVA